MKKLLQYSLKDIERYLYEFDIMKAVNAIIFQAINTK